ncbi:lipoprotein-releasing system permease protein [Flagellimonas taeanensis]|uniref:Lipoprotein-releasing system permease protein n=1 Tax=Flagellimonas taeanensis TaxID=1005926 RepID=A0A1M6Q749_9FLAO|nr:FtsX-like permease family protein [Allomuricauda taeanensis]SFB69381.1 lipoprotein-releasing system permease protein [Allomuricauda taeanensis]SHK16021.1 lipoprotein-releasing system permease protein [Allomuricauda taeanensis]
MNFPFYIAKRYLRSKSSQNAVNIINFVTFLVIVIGSAALFIVLSAFAGLKTFSLSFSNTFDPDLKASPTTGKYFSLMPSEEAALQDIPELANFSKELEERAYLTFKEKSTIAYIKGVDERYRSVTGVDSTLQFGNWGNMEYNGVIGIGIYNLLGVPTNNRTPMMVLVPKPGKGSFTQQGLTNSKPYNELPLVVSGVYAVEEGLDKKYVFAQLPLIQKLLEKDSTMVSGINFKLNDLSKIDAVKSSIQAVLGDKVQLLTRQEQNSTLHRMLKTENLATYLIFTLVLIIALFNVVGAIIMMILDKQQNSKTLFSLGTTIKELRRIYFIQGLLVTSLGGLIGVLIGTLLIVSQLVFGWLKITPSLAYPVEFDAMNLLIVMATIVVLGFISSKIASSRISKKMIAA